MRPIIIMICGPHIEDDRDSPQYHRIDAAIQVARELLERGQWPEILVCGDARQGQDIERFVARANDALAMPRAVGCYDEGASTLTDVRAAIRWLNDLDSEEPTQVVQLTLVTDWWHLPRAQIMLFGEMARRLDPHVQMRHYTACPVYGGVLPTPEQHCREQAGTIAYLNGTYRSNTDLSWGKPSPLVPSAPSSSTSTSSS